ncbi:hypothetical protein AMEX_G21209 [Astyanax mexicanus]|uniref:Ig-like domain-containing protein n=1 Tax=Astyanax mexicanus TaxID=7994 RepID=A0A8T2L4J4_ASTMX|nr:hypothetical protein AMEX_G21209 [Astyanax mexicanus]
MALLMFLLLWMFSDLCQSLESPGLERRGIVLEQDVMGVLGEEVYLRCLYTGNETVMFSTWNRVNSETNSVMMSGFKYANKAFSKESFSIPESQTNLTVKVGITSVTMEGRYDCAFTLEENIIKESLFLTVNVRPEIRTRVEEDVVNGTLYQTVHCSAINAKPMALIRWEIRGVPPDPDVFYIYTTNSTHPNRTGSVVSVLRLPVLLNNESRVSCVVQHPALLRPTVSDVELQTYVPPSISMKMEVKQKNGQDILQVLCSATGGRPQPNIIWILPDSAPAQLPQNPEVESESITSSHWFPPDLCEGENITCVIGYPLRPAVQTKTITLPTYYITSLQLKGGRSETSSDKTSDLVRLADGDGEVVIRMEVIGNVPSYTINCTREDGPMPKEVNVVDSDILIKGPVGFNISGQYRCQASYHRHSAVLQLQIEVNPRVEIPVTFPPNISAQLWKEGANTYVECLASDAAPAANVSWDLPQDLNVEIQSDVSSCNGTHTVRSVLTLPACFFQETTVECVVEHLDLLQQERRPVHLPICVPVNVTLQSMVVWVNGMAYTQVNCSADSVPPDSTVFWNTENCRMGINMSEPSEVLIQSGTLQGDGGGVWSSARLPVHSYAGCTVVCVLEHHRPERNSVQLPSGGPPSVGMKVGPLRDSGLWAAVCEYQGFGLVPNITWIISDHNTAATTIVPVTLQPVFQGISVLVNTSYKFELSQHEGRNITCLIRDHYGMEERRTVNIPKYFISSIVVLNDTSLLRGNSGHVYRVALQEAIPQQIISFRVMGNTPAFSIRCFRADGSAAHTGSTALVFVEPVSEWDAGLYTCHASWYHHKATVLVQVEVTSRETQKMTFFLICFSSATAISLFLLVTRCVCVWREQALRQRESLAGLVQTPCSPDISMATLPSGRGSEYAELLRYSIVLDQKSTV